MSYFFKIVVDDYFASIKEICTGLINDKNFGSSGLKELIYSNKIVYNKDVKRAPAVTDAQGLT